MSKQKESLYREQKKIKPKIDDIIANIISGEKLKLANDFIAYLRENKMNPAWSSANSWIVKYKGKSLLYIKLLDKSNSWRIMMPPDGGWEDYDGEFQSAEHLKEIVWANINYCTDCSSCKGWRKTILGKECENVCHISIHFMNPGVEEIESLKKLVQVKRKMISSWLELNSSNEAVKNNE